MSSVKTWFVAVAVGVVGITAYVVAGPGHDCAPGVAPLLDPIRNLAGDWVAIGEDGKPTDQVVSSFRVTSGGTAVREVIFPGTEHEMVTMYYQDGDDLYLTHYCVLGNQPRMKANRGDGRSFVFRCIGGTNLKSEDEKHMHQGIITIVDREHLRGEWLAVEKGKTIETHKIDLVRKNRA